MDTPGLHRVSPLGSGKLTDAELVARCCAGDRGAWRSLYERHASQVYRFLSAMGIRDSDREDACQDVFIAVYRSLPSFRGDSQLSTWIYRITSRTTSRLIQKKRLRQAIASLLDAEPPPQSGPDPSEETARALVLERMLERLNPKKRTVLVLFELEGVPVEEISRIVGCPTNTVWSRLHHARLELAKMAQRMTAERMKMDGTTMAAATPFPSPERARASEGVRPSKRNPTSTATDPEGLQTKGESP
jgi:RNA polymerase sigma-70 factor (ECF subfamily)